MATEILTIRQQLLLKEFGKHFFIQQHFYLTGGTALAGFYLFHRYSEDLGFFSEQEFGTSSIITFLKDIKKSFQF